MIWDQRHYIFNLSAVFLTFLWSCIIFFFQLYLLGCEMQWKEMDKGSFNAQVVIDHLDHAETLIILQRNPFLVIYKKSVESFSNCQKITCIRMLYLFLQFEGRNEKDVHVIENWFWSILLFGQWSLNSIGHGPKLTLIIMNHFSAYLNNSHLIMHMRIMLLMQIKTLQYIFQIRFPLFLFAFGPSHFDCKVL